MVTLKYLSNFWGTLEVLSINCEINLILTWSVNSAILSGVAANEGTTFEITYIKFHVLALTLLFHGNVVTAIEIRILKNNYLE